MFEWLYRIFVGHLHKWEIVDNISHSKEYSSGSTSVRHGTLLKCAHCGKLKNHWLKE